MVFTDEFVLIWGITTCSVYGPVPATTLNTIGPAVPQAIALIADPKEVKLVLLAAINLLMV